MGPVLCLILYKFQSIAISSGGTTCSQVSFYILVTQFLRSPPFPFPSPTYPAPNFTAWISFPICSSGLLTTCPNHLGSHSLLFFYWCDLCLISSMIFLTSITSEVSCPWWLLCISSLLKTLIHIVVVALILTCRVLPSENWHVPVTDHSIKFPSFHPCLIYSVLNFLANLCSLIKWTPGTWTCIWMIFTGHSVPQLYFLCYCLKMCITCTPFSLLMKRLCLSKMCHHLFKSLSACSLFSAIKVSSSANIISKEASF